MPRHPVELNGIGRPLLDLTSYSRPGPGRRDRLSPAEIEHVSRTVRRTPEVMVKVLTQGGQDLKAVQRHFAYLDRKGDLAIETDEGESVQGKAAGKELLQDWDLEIEAHRRSVTLAPRGSRPAPRLVHKLLFSMPPGTPPDKVLNAVASFAREEFALKHRYAMVLHTDEPHPHVHLVLKAMSEQGERLNIRKATLRDWRSKFAEKLRREGIAANATERAVRGLHRSRLADPIYRANERGASRFIRERADQAVSAANRTAVERSRRTLWITRNAVEEGWRAVGGILVQQGHSELAAQVGRFAEQLPAAKSESEQQRNQHVPVRAQ